MALIVSPHNPRLMAVRRLRTRRARERSGTFLAEGEDLVLAAKRAGRPPLAGYRLAGSELGDDGFTDVSAGALAGVSTLGSGTRVMGVYEQRWSVPTGPICVYLHGVRDPGNVGTVLRGAQAFGAASVALGPGCADPHSPKAVRASMGAIFDLSLARVADLAQLPGERIALVAHGGEPLPGLSGLLAGPRPVSLLVGAEREGLPSEVVAAADRAVRIPTAADSLNAAMAATVALYELTRAPAGGSSDVRRARVRGS
jgi:TrmH family RNA methyltransferase